MLNNVLIRSLLLLLTLSALTAHAKEQEIDRLLVIVEDDIVMESELQSRMRVIAARLKKQNTPIPPPDVMRERVLDKMIIDSIMLQKAARAGLRVSDDQLNDTMRRIAEQNDFTLAEFQAALREEGLTYTEAREQIRQEMLISRIQQRQVDLRVRVTEQEVKNFLASAAGQRFSATDYLLGHILVSVPENAPDNQKAELRKRAIDIRQKLLNGADFRETAVEFSDGRNALQGGVIGWRKENQLPSLASKIVPTLAVNQPSDIVESSSGLHIIAVLEKRGGSVQLVDQTHVRHILIKPSELRSEEEAREFITQLRERILQGESFEDIAKANSDDPVSAVSGGDLGWVISGDLTPEFEDIMNHSDFNTVSGVFRTEFGWHILEVLGRRKEDMGAELQAGQARQILHKREYEEELIQWMNEIREEAYVEFKS